jgi:hypothetical protein
MRATSVPALASAVALVVVSWADVRAQQRARFDENVTVTVPAEKFSGTWDYNAQESVNAATGRPEQAARSATQRGARGTGGRGANPTAPPGASGSNGGGGISSRDLPTREPSSSPLAGGGSPGFGSGGSGGGRAGFSPMAAIETRSLTRDLLEVPEAYTISVAADRVTFIDDLERGLTYPTDGRKAKYQLGAAQFDAKVRWTGAELKKDIQGSFGFRMSETYFLSTDGQRLFVIVRLGEQKPGAPIVGFNRVYDRVPQPAGRTAGPGGI